MASLDNTTMANFIPEVWADEVVATYKANLVLANLVRGINHKGKKGDTINIPGASRGAASAKATGTASTIQAISNSTNNALSLSEHYQYSVRIDDITDMQAVSSMRRFYTDDAGHALASVVDTNIITALRASTGNTDITSVTNWDTSLLAGLEALNDNDTPMNERSLVVSPSCMTALLSTDRFTEQAFVGDGNAIKTGKVGSIYGVDVFVSTAVGTGATEKAILFQKEALVLATQQDIRVQTQYQQEYLADLLTADTVYGTLLVQGTSVVELSS
jgi:hypothetical protein